MLASGHPTFGSFNNGSKLTDETLALWARLLATIPTARLVVVGVAEGSAQARVRAVFGAAAARVRVTARVAPDAFRRETAAVDIALDPRPFSGATTTLEMLIPGRARRHLAGHDAAVALDREPLVRARARRLDRARRR